MNTSIGSRLKEARDQKYITLDQVYSKIKIHTRILESMEADKFEELPNPIFAKSFLKSYAEFLQLDPIEIIEAYEKINQPEPKQELYIESVDEKEKASFEEILNKRNWKTPLKIFGVVSALFFVGWLLVGFNSWVWSHFKKESPQKTASSVVKRVAAPPAPKSQKTPPAGNWLRTPQQGNFPKIGKKTPLSLKMKAVDDVWVRITSDGEILFQTILKKGTSQNWKAQNLIEIWTGNSANMALTVNEFYLGSPGKGVIRKMVIDREGVKIAN